MRGTEAPLAPLPFTTTTDGHLSGSTVQAALTAVEERWRVALQTLPALTGPTPATVTNPDPSSTRRHSGRAVLAGLMAEGRGTEALPAPQALPALPPHTPATAMN